jgi:DNA mismatch endonuclease, patch repair protein
MQAIRSTDTRPERRLRSALHARGLRYRVHRRPIAGLNRKADVVFTRAKVAVFSDGCFWHGCEEHGRRRHEVNGWYWPDKIARNVARDRDTDQRLTDAGWVVVRVWEHDDPEQAADSVAAIVRQRAAQP